jgi:RNA polymerase primary sigma factor
MNNQKSEDLDSLNNYYRMLKVYPPITKNEEFELAEKIRNGDKKSFDKLVNSNLRFVVSVARNYQNQGLSLQDLISEGNLGLIKAVKEFDERKNFKFISYAVWWIRQSILKALSEQSRIVKVPLHQIIVICNIGKIYDKVEQNLGRSPSVEELSEELKIDNDNIKVALEVLNGNQISLEKPITKDGDLNLRDIIEDKSIEPTDFLVTNQSTKDMIEEFLVHIPKTEKIVLELYFGINEDIGLTLKEIGQKCGVTRERVRQIKENAISRLKKRYFDKFKE